MSFTSVNFGFAAIGLVLVITGTFGQAFVRRLKRKLSRQRFQLDTALNNMSHGLCVFDAAGVLRLMNARYLEIFNIPQGLIVPGCGLRELIIYDSDDRYVLCNKRFDEMYPKTADLRVPGMQFARILRAGVARGVYPEAAGREEDWIAERLAAHREPSSIFELRHSNGRWVRAEDSHMPNRGFVGIRVDVTQLKQREEQLRLENIKLDAALQNMSHGLVMFDRDGNLIVCNQKYADLYRLPPELIRPGVSHRQILDHRIANGIVEDSNSVRFVKDRSAVGAPKSPTETIWSWLTGAPCWWRSARCRT